MCLFVHPVFTLCVCRPDFFLIEWHLSKISESLRLGALGLRLSLAQTLERGCPQRPPRAAWGLGSGRANAEGAARTSRFLQHDEAQLSRHASIPGLWERARWHNGSPPMRNGTTGGMAWSNPGAIQAQAQVAGGPDSFN